jgi:MFS family permease
LREALKHACHPDPKAKLMSANAEVHWLKRYHGITAFTAMLILMLSNGLTLTGLTPFRVVYGQEFGWSMAQMTLADLVAFGFLGLIAPILGVWMDRIGVKRMMLMGGLVLALSYFLYARINSLAQMYLVHVLFGLGLALAGLVPVARLIGRWFVKARGTAMGIALVGSSLASYTIAPLANSLITQHGWRGAFAWMSIAGIALTLLVLTLVRDRPEDSNERAYGAKDLVAVKESDLPGVDFHEALRSFSFWCLSLGAAATFFSMLGMLYNMLPHAIDLGFDRAGGIKALQMMLLAALIGKFGFGWLADLLETKRVYLANLLVMAIGASAMALAGKDQLYLAAFIFGLGWGGLYTMLQVLAVQTFGMKCAGRVMGTIAIFDAVGGGLGSFALGLIRTLSGSYYPAFWLMVGLILLAFVLATQIRPVYRAAS